MMQTRESSGMLHMGMLLKRIHWEIFAMRVVLTTEPLLPSEDCETTGMMLEESVVELSPLGDEMSSPP